MKMSMLALALALVAPAAFSQTQTNLPVTHKTHAKSHRKSKAAQLDPSALGQIKILRQEIKRERVELSAKGKSLHASHAALLVQEKAELAQITKALGNKAEKKARRLAVRQRYAALFKDAREKHQTHGRMVREDIQSKRAMISKLRQS